MKTIHPLNLAQIGLITVFYFCLATGNGKCQTSDSTLKQDTPVKLSGSRLKAEDMIAKADIILIGEITSINAPSPLAPGQGTYHGVTVKVLSLLKGQVDSQIVVSLIAISIKGKIEETPPTVGKSYIFFVKKNENTDIRVLKLLDATDEAIAHIKALIAAAPASK